jgi:hypothetical protein
MAEEYTATIETNSATVQMSGPNPQTASGQALRMIRELERSYYHDNE